MFPFDPAHLCQRPVSIMKESLLRSEFLAQFDELYTPLKLKRHSLSEGELLLDLSYRSRSLQIWCRAISRGTPLLVDLTGNAMDSPRAPQALRTRAIEGQLLPALLAPHLPTSAIDKCRELGLACFDLSGNVVIETEDLSILQTGRKKRIDDEPKRRPFSGKSSRVARVILTSDRDAWVSRDLAEAAGVSASNVVYAIRTFTDNEWVRVFRGKTGGIEVHDRTHILNAWREVYRLDTIETVRLFSINTPEEAARQVAAYCDQHNIAYALTSFVGASLLSATGNFTESTLLTTASSAQIKTLAKALKLVPAARGNIALVRIEDNMILTGATHIEGCQVAHPIQIYLDLYADPRRGREQAEMFREAVIGF